MSHRQTDNVSVKLLIHSVCWNVLNQPVDVQMTSDPPPLSLSLTHTHTLSCGGVNVGEGVLGFLEGEGRGRGWGVIVNSNYHTQVVSQQDIQSVCLMILTNTISMRTHKHTHTHTHTRFPPVQSVVCCPITGKCLNETTEVVWDIKRPHSEHGDSSTH